MEPLQELVQRHRLQLTTLLDAHQSELEVAFASAPGAASASKSAASVGGERGRLPTIAEQGQIGERVALDGSPAEEELNLEPVFMDRQMSPTSQTIESSTNSMQWRMHASLASSDGSYPAAAVGAVPTENSRNVVDASQAEPPQPPQNSQFGSYADFCAGILVILSSVSQVLELELKGRSTAAALGVEGGADFTDYLHLFRYSNSFFDIAFLIEWVILVVVYRRNPCKSGANAFDTFLMAVGLVDLYFNLAIWVVVTELADTTLTWYVLQAVTALRAIRMLRTFRLCRGIRLLLRACQAFLPSLGWAMVLLAVFMSAGSLIMGTLLQPFINGSAELEDRVWIWYHYGTAYRSFYTLYEITFAGNWPVKTRPVMDKVSQAFSIFFLIYVTVIVFAIIRVITAVFLKDTLDAAHNDAEHLVAEALRKKAEYVEKLESVFQQIDDSGQGMITEARLNEILQDPKVAVYFQTLDLDVHEGTALFHILDNGDGEVTLDEFINGILRCRGPARAIDQVAMRAELKHLDLKLARLTKTFKESGFIRTKDSGKTVGGRRGDHMKVFRLAEPVNRFARLNSG